MHFRLTPRSMTLDDLELYKFEFSENCSGFRRFRTQQQLNEWRYCQRQRCKHVELELFLACFRVARVLSATDTATDNVNLKSALTRKPSCLSDSWAFLLAHFSNLRYVDLFGRCLRSKSKVVRNRVEFWTFLPFQILLGAPLPKPIPKLSRVLRGTSRGLVYWTYSHYPQSYRR